MVISDIPKAKFKQRRVRGHHSLQLTEIAGSRDRLETSAGTKWVGTKLACTPLHLRV